MLTQANGDYIKALHKLEQGQGPVTVKAIAAQMGVSPASVTKMMKQLAKLRLVSRLPYKGVSLTSSGRKVALELIRHHRLLELYLKDVVGLSWDMVDEEADRLEHVISEALEDRIDQALGSPTTDPHGDPIPSKDGELIEPEYQPLSEIEAGRTVVILRVSDRDPEVLQYLGELGIFPKVAVTVTDRAPFQGPLFLSVASQQHILGLELASRIFVARGENVKGAPTPK